MTDANARIKIRNACFMTLPIIERLIVIAQRTLKFIPYAVYDWSKKVVEVMKRSVISKC